LFRDGAARNMAATADSPEDAANTRFKPIHSFVVGPNRSMATKSAGAELMHHESRATRSAMLALKQHDAASFSVHDSLIVPQSAESLAVQFLADEYHFGVGAQSIALIVHARNEPPRHVVGRREVQEWQTSRHN
jgi:hypothetical protein